MNKYAIREGRCYRRYDEHGTIRYVEELHSRFSAGAFVVFKSRRPDDPIGKWPGSGGSYLDVFAANCECEVECPDGR